MSLSISHLHDEIDRVGKPREVEGVLDLYLIRPSGYLIARAVYPTAIGPNTLSVLAVVFGWASAWGFYRAAAGEDVALWGAFAGLMMWIHSAFDSADGQLARWRDETSELGRVIDGLCDYLTFLAIYLAIGAGLAVRFDAYTAPIFAVAVVGALSHALQCALVEYQRNLYRAHVYGTPMPESGGPAGRAERPPSWLQALHRGYAAVQQLLCGSSEELSRVVARQRHGADHTASLIRKHQRALLPFWAMLAPNSHKVMMVATAFLPTAGTTLAGRLGMGWYLIYDVVVLNAFLLLMLLWQRRVDGLIKRELAGGTR